jgi:N-acetylneuraminate synthase
VTAPVRIGTREVSPDAPPLLVAEMSANHNGSLSRALEIVDAMAEAGADALKLQTYTPDTLTLDVDAPAFRVSTDHALWGSRNLYDLYREAATPWEWHEPIFARARERGLLAFSSAFDPTAIRFLEDLDVPAHKVASAEIVDLPLVRALAETGKPLIISTGMASLAEVLAAVDAARGAGNDQLVVLACTAAYPAPVSETNLRGIPVLREALGCQVGYSDHTEGIGAAVAAVALGASLIEKHVTLRRADGGVDSAFSLEPEEVTLLVRSMRDGWAALGRPVIGASPAEGAVRRLRRSLYVTRDVAAGEPVSAGNVRSIRPAGGLPPDAFSQVEGRRFVRDVATGTPFTWDLV